MSSLYLSQRDYCLILAGYVNLFAYHCCFHGDQISKWLFFIFYFFYLLIVVVGCQGLQGLPCWPKHT